MKRPRLCLLSSHFPPDPDGIGDYSYFLANALSHSGFDVQVVTSQGTVDPVLYPLSGAVRVDRVVTDWSLLGARRVLRAVTAAGPDVVLVQYAPHAFDRRGITLAVNVLPILLRFVSGTRVLVNLHELNIPFGRHPLHWSASVWQRVMAFVIAQGGDWTTAVSDEWGRRLRRMGVRRPVVVVPVGSNIPQVTMAPEKRAAIRQALGVDGEDLLVGCFGSAGSHRSEHLLRYAVRRLRHYRPTKSVWFGDAHRQTQRAPLDEVVEDCISWTGRLPHPDISRVLSACDVLALPFEGGVSARRGTLAAGLLHGLPILTTRGKRLEDWFIHRVNVYLAPAGDANAFAEGLRELANKPELRASLGRAAREVYDRAFSWDIIARRVAEVMEVSLS